MRDVRRRLENLERVKSEADGWTPAMFKTLTDEELEAFLGLPTYRNGKGQDGFHVAAFTSAQHSWVEEMWNATRARLSAGVPGPPAARPD